MLSDLTDKGNNDLPQRCKTPHYFHLGILNINNVEWLIRNIKFHDRYSFHARRLKKVREL